MSDIDDKHEVFVSHIVGLFNLISNVSSLDMGHVDYQTLGNQEYQSVTYFRNELNELKSRLGGK